MRCPKCQYISFDSGGRCRNCGYEFSLAADDASFDVTIGRDEPRSGRLDDASLAAALETPLTPPSAARSLDDDVDLQAAEGPRVPFTAADLPLFTDRVADDQAPLVTPPAVPRQPLAVRRTNPGVRPRSRNPLPEELAFDLVPETDSVKAARDRQRAADDAGAPDRTAGLVRRVGAEAIDGGILGLIETAVVYLTLRVCDLSPEQWRVLPLVPLILFMLLLCGGYFVLFTVAGGQTIGKMLTGIRVVASATGGGAVVRVPIGAAVLRAIASLGSVGFLGLGFLPMLLDGERRAFHDRVAETRVILA